MGGVLMKPWSFTFFLAAVVTALLGFGGTVGIAAAWIGKILFLIFLVLFVASLISTRKATF